MQQIANPPIDVTSLPTGTPASAHSLDARASLWRPHELPQSVRDGIFAFMRDLGLHFGRLDFLFDGSRHLFLEVNPNGQWGWLDTQGNHGLLNKIIAEISPATPCHAIPCRAQVRT